MMQEYLFFYDKSRKQDAPNTGFLQIWDAPPLSVPSVTLWFVKEKPMSQLI